MVTRSQVVDIPLVRRVRCQAGVCGLRSLGLLLARDDGGVRHHPLRSLPGRGVSLAVPVLRDPQALLKRHSFIGIHTGVYLVYVYFRRRTG